MMGIIWPSMAWSPSTVWMASITGSSSSTDASRCFQNTVVPFAFAPTTFWYLSTLTLPANAACHASSMVAARMASLHSSTSLAMKTIMPQRVGQLDAMVFFCKPIQVCIKLQHSHICTNNFFTLTSAQAASAPSYAVASFAPSHAPAVSAPSHLHHHLLHHHMQ